MQDPISNTIDPIKPSSSNTTPPTRPLQGHEIQRQALIGRLTSNIVHELNNPMQAIRGSASLALEDLSNTEDVKQYLQIIQQSSERALSLIKLVHSLYAPSRGTSTPIDLYHLMLILMPILKDDLNHKGLVMQIKPLEKPVFIWGVETALQQFMLTLFLLLDQKVFSSKNKSYAVSFEQTEGHGCLHVLLPVEFSAREEWNREDFQYLVELLREMNGVFSTENGEENSSLTFAFPLAFPKAGADDN